MGAEGRLSSRRNTFELPPSSRGSKLVPTPDNKRSPLSPHLTENGYVPEGTNWAAARYLSTPGNGIRQPRSDQPACVIPNPVLKTHNVDGHSTYDLKTVGAFGGAGKKGNKKWIGGADRTCNALM